MNTWGRNREVEKPRSRHQRSVLQMPEGEQDAAMDSVDAATEKYPQVAVGDSALHICEMDGGWQVWLNCEDATFTGLCLSSEATQQEAVQKAVQTLEAALDVLQGPPSMLPRLTDVCLCIAHVVSPHCPLHGPDSEAHKKS